MPRPDPATTLFVYGSLIDQSRRDAILERPVESAPALLRDYDRRRARHFYVFKRNGFVTRGLLLLNLTRRDFAKLDQYEEVPRLYTRAQLDVETDDGQVVRCWIYLPTVEATR
jgi:gamma-glutamylcyclotransferase (GGCT)/AIG2-like uncharacterized protein YtfP